MVTKFLPQRLLLLAITMFGICCERGQTPTRAPEQPRRQPVYFMRHIPILGSEQEINVSPAGGLHEVRRLGGNVVSTRRASLTGAQLRELDDLFRGWEELKGEYPALPDGPVIHIRYGTKLVTSGQVAQPEQLTRIVDYLARIAEAP